MNKWDEFWNWFLHSRTDGAMVARTVGEALLGWIIANLGDICNAFSLTSNVKMFIMGLVTVVSSSALSYIRQNSEKHE